MYPTAVLRVEQADMENPASQHEYMPMWMRVLLVIFVVLAITALTAMIVVR